MSVALNCQECSKTFYVVASIRSQRFCSVNCYKLNTKKRRMHVCPVCSNEFYSTRLRAVTCSFECAAKKKIKVRHEANCKECGKHFTSKLAKDAYEALGHPLPVFCSKQCFYTNKNNKTEIVCIECGKKRLVSASVTKYSACKFCSLRCVGKYYSGNRSPLYIDGSTSTKDQLRKSEEYRAWRTSVFIRDGKKCVWCNSKTNIEADHIKPQAIFPELRYDINNGRTLCHDCHTKTFTYMKRLTRKEYEKLAVTYYA